jgi:DNA polymerase-3 subunit delta'
VDTEARMEAAGLYSPAGERTASKSIGVRLVRELVIPRVALRAMGGRRKVVIFHDADFTEVAQNSFLKTLEEPPPDTTFILLSSRADSLKITIRSRCLRVPFGPLPLEVVAARVAKDRKMPYEEALLCASVAGGSMGGALAIDPKTLAQRRQTILAAEKLGTNDHLGWLDLAAILGEKDSAEGALDVLETWYQDVARLAASDLPPQTHLDLADEARASGQRIGVRGAVARIEALRRARADIERNAQARLALERAFLSFCGIRPAAPGEGA